MILTNNSKSMSVTYLPTGKPKSNCSLDGIQQSWRNWNVQSEIYKSPFHFHEYYEDSFDPSWGISWEFFILQSTLWVSPALPCRAHWEEATFRRLRLLCRCILLNSCLAATEHHHALLVTLFCRCLSCLFIISVYVKGKIYKQTWSRISENYWILKNYPNLLLNRHLPKLLVSSLNFVYCQGQCEIFLQEAFLFVCERRGT